MDVNPSFHNAAVMPIVHTTRGIKRDFFLLYSGLGPATSKPSSPCIGSSSLAPAADCACSAARRSSSLTACSASHPSCEFVSKGGLQYLVFKTGESMFSNLLPEGRLAPQALVSALGRLRGRDLDHTAEEFCLVHIVDSFFGVVGVFILHVCKSSVGLGGFRVLILG